MDPADNQNHRATKPVATPVRWLTDPQFDFVETGPLRKSYVIASSDRASSTLLCRYLWQTGRFGAPWEYLNSSFENARGTLAAPADRSIASAMMQRLGARGPRAYIARLLACRTSSNGVFGLKSNFNDLKSALSEFHDLLNALAPVSYIYVDRRDKLAQAASAVKFLLTNSDAGKLEAAGERLPYDRDLMSKSLGKLERSRLHWWRWFEQNGIAPLVLYHEDVNDDGPQAVRTVARALDVEYETTDQIVLPPFDQQSDPVIEEWAARFGREIACGIRIRQSDPAHHPSLAMISDPARIAFPHDSGGLEASAAEANRTEQDIRLLLPRYDQIIGANRAQLRNATVLDLVCGRGLCSLAALDAGAAFVTGVDPRPGHIAFAARALADRGIPASSYQFVTMGTMPALHDIAPETFGVIIGRGVLERVDVRRFFAQLKYLRPNRVILDSELASGHGPLTRFGLRNVSAAVPGQAADRSDIVSLPNHDLIELLCDNFGFRWRLADEPDSSAGRTTGPDGAARPSTYILDRIE